MVNCAQTGLVPDIKPPVTKEQEAALRPMCDQLKVGENMPIYVDDIIFKLEIQGASRPSF